MDQLEEKTKTLFEDYFASARENSLAFGISASKLCSKLEKFNRSVPESRLENLIHIDFKRDEKDTTPDELTLNKTSSYEGIEISMNRKYNAGYSLAAIGGLIKEGDYYVTISSSEIARNDHSGIYDLSINIRNNKTGKIVNVDEKYAMKNRLMNGRLVGKFLSDLKDYLHLSPEIDEEEIRAMIQEDERCCDVYFADTSKREIIDNEFALVPENSGFKIWYGKGLPWEREIYYPDSFNMITGKDAKTFEGLYEEDVYNILYHKGDIQNKLDICMIIFENKKKLEQIYPVSKVTV